MLVGSPHSIQGNAESLIVASKEIRLEVNAYKTKYIVISEIRMLDEVTVKTDNRSFARVKLFKHLGKSQTNRNSVKEESKSRLEAGNACYQSVQNLSSSSLISKNINIKIYRIIVLLVILCGCETWSPTLREERRLRVFENKVLRRIFGPMGEELRGEWVKVK